MAQEVLQVINSLERVPNLLAQIAQALQPIIGGVGTIQQSLGGPAAAQQPIGPRAVNMVSVQQDTAATLAAVTEAHQKKAAAEKTLSEAKIAIPTSHGNVVKPALQATLDDLRNPQAHFVGATKGEVTRAQIDLAQADSIIKAAAADTAARQAASNQVGPEPVAGMPASYLTGKALYDAKDRREAMKAVALGQGTHLQYDLSDAPHLQAGAAKITGGQDKDLIERLKAAGQTGGPGTALSQTFANEMEKISIRLKTLTESFATNTSQVSDALNKAGGDVTKVDSKLVETNKRLAEEIDDLTGEYRRYKKGSGDLPGGEPPDAAGGPSKAQRAIQIANAANMVIGAGVGVYSAYKTTQAHLYEGSIGKEREYFENKFAIEGLRESREMQQFDLMNPRNVLKFHGDQLLPGMSNFLGASGRERALGISAREVMDQYKIDEIKYDRDKVNAAGQMVQGAIETGVGGVAAIAGGGATSILGAGMAVGGISKMTSGAQALSANEAFNKYSQLAGGINASAYAKMQLGEAEARRRGDFTSAATLLEMQRKVESGADQMAENELSSKPREVEGWKQRMDFIQVRQQGVGLIGPYAVTEKQLMGRLYGDTTGRVFKGAEGTITTETQNDALNKISRNNERAKAHSAAIASARETRDTGGFTAAGDVLAKHEKLVSERPWWDVGGIVGSYMRGRETGVPGDTGSLLGGLKNVWAESGGTTLDYMMALGADKLYGEDEATKRKRSAQAGVILARQKKKLAAEDKETVSTAGGLPGGYERDSAEALARESERSAQVAAKEKADKRAQENADAQTGQTKSAISAEEARAEAMRLSRILIKGNEGIALKPYWDHKGYSIGFGHLLPGSAELLKPEYTKDKKLTAAGKEKFETMFPEMVNLTNAGANAIFERDIKTIAMAPVDDRIKSLGITNLSPMQKAQLYDAAYNMGGGAFKDSGILEAYATKGVDAAADLIAQGGEHKAGIRASGQIFEPLVKRAAKRASAFRGGTGDKSGGGIIPFAPELGEAAPTEDLVMTLASERGMSVPQFAANMNMVNSVLGSRAIAKGEGGYAGTLAATGATRVGISAIESVGETAKMIDMSRSGLGSMTQLLGNVSEMNRVSGGQNNIPQLERALTIAVEAGFNKSALAQSFVRTTTGLAEQINMTRVDKLATTMAAGSQMFGAVAGVADERGLKLAAEATASFNQWGAQQGTTLSAMRTKGYLSAGATVPDLALLKGMTPGAIDEAATDLEAGKVSQNAVIRAFVSRQTGKTYEERATSAAKILRAGEESSTGATLEAFYNQQSNKRGEAPLKLRGEQIATMVVKTPEDQKLKEAAVDRYLGDVLSAASATNADPKAAMGMALNQLVKSGVYTKDQAGEAMKAHMAQAKGLYDDQGQKAQAKYTSDLMMNAFATDKLGKSEKRIKEVYGAYVGAGGAPMEFEGKALDKERFEKIMKTPGKEKTALLEKFKDKDASEFARAYESQKGEGAQSVNIMNTRAIGEAVAVAINGIKKLSNSTPSTPNKNLNGVPE